MPSIFKKAKTPEGSLKFGVMAAIIILLAAGGLRLAQWMNPPRPTPLLPQDETLVHVNTIDEISAYTNTSVREPKNTFGSTLHIIGIYPEKNAYFPPGTVALVYVKNGFRFIEANFRPGTTLEQEESRLEALKKETIILAPDINGILTHLRINTYCKQPTEEAIGVCQISKALLFEKDGTVIVLSADGEHVTDGELIEMARSLIDPVVPK